FMPKAPAAPPSPAGGGLPFAKPSTPQMPAQPAAAQPPAPAAAPPGLAPQPPGLAPQPPGLAPQPPGLAPPLMSVAEGRPGWGAPPPPPPAGAPGRVPPGMAEPPAFRQAVSAESRWAGGAGSGPPADPMPSALHGAQAPTGVQGLSASKEAPG